jgi:hypothetical protein
LGWSIAYLAESSVDRSRTKRDQVQVIPAICDGNPGIALYVQF